MADDRPQYQHGVGTIGGQSFHWGSGQPGAYWSIPYGDYPVTPDAPTGAWAHQAGAIPLANNVIPDPLLGRNRIGIMIHSGSSDSLDQLYTQGCFKVAPSEWPSVRAEILKEAGNGPLYLHVQTGGVASFTNTKTQQQVSVPTAGAPGPPVVASGTRINAASAPVAGALANQGPETVGSNQAYKFTLPDNAPMGMGHNNPLNIQYYQGAATEYSGQVGPSSNTDQGDPQMKFASPEAGWNAAYNLLNKKYSGGMTTPNQIIAGKGGWTPGNTQAAANVAKAAGVGPDDDIGFSDPNKAQKFMRALVTQEQGAAAKAYPDEMIAAAVGGNAPAAGAASSSTTAAPAVAATPLTRPDQSWWGKLTQPEIDPDTGKPVPGAKSPFQQAAAALLNSPQTMKAAEEEQAPARSALSSQGPGARNVSPMGGALLPSVPQTYGQTINSLSAPLTWNSAPPRAPQTPAAGLRGSPGSQIPGMSLTSVPAMSQGLGYGIDPNDLGLGVGYG